MAQTLQIHSNSFTRTDISSVGTHAPKNGLLLQNVLQYVTLLLTCLSTSQVSLMRRYRMLQLPCILIFLVGCAPTTQWHNPNFTEDQADALERQRTIDEGYCTMVVQGAVPMPEVRAYVPQQQSYTIYGSSMTHGSQGLHTGYYQANVAPSAGTSFSSGFAQGAALGAVIRARRAQEAVMKSCMYQLGWTDKPTEELETQK